MSERDVLVVVGYGCHLTEGMRNYLNAVIEFTKTNEVLAIITTGGFTNRRSAPGISEAGMMAKYLITKLSLPIILEETARTTAENLKGVKQILQDRPFGQDHIVIFCDSCRNLKVKLLARFILGFWPEVKTYNLTRSVLTKAKQLLVATPLNVLALWVPFLEKMELKRCERIMDNN